ncbi:FtsX-like permease family protein [Oscillospiraceae bacterium PP1C4]
MYARMIQNDMSKSKIITLTIAIFVAAATMLISLTAVLAVNLTGAIETLMEQAETPHFMQMHSGEIDKARLADFARKNENVEEFQIIDFLNIEGTQITFGKRNLGGNMQDNGFSIQSEEFDYLLDLEGNIIAPRDGEVYVPLCYWKNATTEVGKKVVVCGKEFKVAGFLRDSQMNASLSSSKRFLITEKDYREIEPKGKVEYLIEFRLKDITKLSAFETSYISAGLESNGPAVTYRLFKMFNMFSDGMVAGVLLLISLLVVAIAFLCIRFTLLAKMEEDYREIGVMKAIGLRVKDIKRMYLAKYAAIGLVGSFVGYRLSLAFQGKILENIRLFMGESKNAFYAPFFAMLGVALVFLVMMIYVNTILRRFRKISSAEAIRFGTKQEKASGTNHFCLSDNRILPTNLFLGIKDVLTKKKLYLTMLIVLILAVFIMVVPQNLYHTVSAKSFSTYMGVGECDIRIDIQQTDNILEKAEEVLKELQNDSMVVQTAPFVTKTFRTNAEESIKVELGNHTSFPVAYSQGKPPVGDNEIALSSINAQELAKKVGDTITLLLPEKNRVMEKNFTVCGVYADVTNGGKTAKATFTNDIAQAMWCKIYIELADSATAKEKAAEYSVKFSYAKVSDIEEYIAQTYGQTISAVKMASYVAVIVALAISILVTLLFMKMLVAKDKYSIAALKAFGFSNRDIANQYLARGMFVLLAGMILGTVLANTLGQAIAGVVISSFGASTFQFVINPLLAYVLFPLLMIGTVFIATLFGTAGIKKVKISENIKE